MVNNEMMKYLLRKKIVPAALSVILGIVIIIARRSALDLLVRIFGWLVIAGGVGFVAVYMTSHNRESGMLGATLGIAAVTVIIGILLIHYAETVVDFFPTMVGILLILNGLSNLTEASVDRDNRIISGIMGVLVILFGLLIVLRPGIVADTIVICIGISLVLNGVFDLYLLHRVREDLM